MKTVEELTDKLARDTLATAKRLGDDLLVERIAEVLGASSSTAQEYYMTYVRVYRAEARARQVLNDLEKKIAATRIEKQ